MRADESEKHWGDRIAVYVWVAVGACARMVTTADATGLVDRAKVKPGTSVQKQNKPGSQTAQPSPKRPSRSGAAIQRGRSSGRRPARRTRRAVGADSARWRTGAAAVRPAVSLIS